MSIKNERLPFFLLYLKKRDAKGMLVPVLGPQVKPWHEKRQTFEERYWGGIYIASGTVRIQASSVKIKIA